MYNSAISSDVMCVVHGISTVSLVHPWSTTTMMVFIPLLSGSSTMKSMDTVWNGFWSNLEVIGCIGMFFLCVWIFVLWQIAHPVT
jgi:hypothetical protein